MQKDNLREIEDEHSKLLKYGMFGLFLMAFSVFLLISVFDLLPGTNVSSDPTVIPANHGMDRLKLQSLQESWAFRDTHAFLVARHGRVVYEWYAKGYGPKKRHYTASLAKSLVGWLSLLVAINDGRIDLDDPAWKTKYPKPDISFAENRRL